MFSHDMSQLMRRFFWAPKTYVINDGSENICNCTLKMFVYLNRVDSRLQECEYHAFFGNIGLKFHVPCMATSAKFPDLVQF